MQKESIKIKSVNLPAHIVSKDDWHTPVKAFRDKFDDPAYPEIIILQSYNLCPIPMITDFSIETWKLYNAIGGIGKMDSPKDYYNAQALYLDGVDIIKNAISDMQPYLKEVS